VRMASGRGGAARVARAQRDGRGEGPPARHVQLYRRREKDVRDGARLLPCLRVRRDVRPGQELVRRGLRRSSRGHAIEQLRASAHRQSSDAHPARWLARPGRAVDLASPRRSPGARAVPRGCPSCGFNRHYDVAAVQRHVSNGRGSAGNRRRRAHRHDRCDEPEREQHSGGRRPARRCQLGRGHGVHEQ
jgi:hypothetical protein